MKKWLLPVLLLTVQPCTGQSAIRSFYSLSGPEKKWIFLHPFVAAKAWHITLESRAAVVQLSTHPDLDTFHHGGRLDAFRHGYWMARLTLAIGERKARSLGRAHERGNYRQFRRKVSEDGTLQDSTATVMDLLNNEAGIQLATTVTVTSTDELANRIIEKIVRGELIILKRNAEGMLCTCNGHPVVLPAGGKRPWRLPYCLVPSNNGR